MLRLNTIILMVLLGSALNGCGTDTGSSNVDTDTDSPASSVENISTVVTGTPVSSNISRFSLRLTDAPVDNAAHVNIQFTSVELISEKKKTSLLFEFNEPILIDLLALQGTATVDLLNDIPVSAGVYSEIRLIVDDADQVNTIELVDGSVHDLEIPNGSKKGLKLKGDIVIPVNRSGRFTIDFDLRKSIVKAGKSGKYKLKPKLRLVNDTEAGHIRGSIDSSWLTDESCSDQDVDSYNAIYVFEGHNIEPADIDQSSELNVEPVTTAAINYDSKAETYLYEAAFLLAGDYTIAFTCNANLEDVESSNNLQFFNVQNVTVLVSDTLFL